MIGDFDSRRFANLVQFDVLIDLVNRLRGHRLAGEVAIMLFLIAEGLFLGCLLQGLGLLLLGLSFDLGSSLVVVRQVAGLAHAHRVKEAVSVLAFRSELVPSELSVAR